MFTFRVRFSLPESVRFPIEENRTEISEDVHLRSLEGDNAIQDSARLDLLGKGHGSEAEAWVEGRRWRDALEAAMARVGAGVDFGERGPRSTATEAGLKLMSEEQGRPIINDAPGLSVFPSDPMPKIASISVAAVKLPAADRLLRSMLAAYELAPHHTPRESLAFDLYSASFFSPVADARLLMLMMAVETLLDPEDRPEDVRAHVQWLIDQTKAAPLPVAERDSILGSLQFLFQDSISRAGQKLAATLSDRTYMDLPAERFFKEAYTIRSALAHGTLPRPSFEKVNVVAGQMELFVGHLLCPKLLEAVPD